MSTLKRFTKKSSTLSDLDRLAVLRAVEGKRAPAGSGAAPTSTPRTFAERATTSTGAPVPKKQDAGTDRSVSLAEIAARTPRDRALDRMTRTAAAGKTAADRRKLR